MALDFPSSPNDGDTYDNFYWDAAAGIWRRQLTITEFNDLSDVTVPTPSDGDLLVYDNASGEWVNEAVTYAIDDLTSVDSANIISAPNYDIDVTTINTDSATYDLDFSDGTGLLTLTMIATNFTLTGSNYKAGAIKTLRLRNTGGSDLTLSYPANWTIVGIVPTSVSAGKTGIFTVTSFTTSDTGCVAAYIEEL